MNGIILMYIHPTDFYKDGSLRLIYRQTSKIATLFFSLISLITVFCTSTPASSVDLRYFPFTPTIFYLGLVFSGRALLES